MAGYPARHRSFVVFRAAVVRLNKQSTLCAVFYYGFGETAGIFEHIAPAIGGDQIFINLREKQGDKRQDTLSVPPSAKTLLQNFSITPADRIIGHPPWYWIAEVPGDHFALFTHPKAIVAPIAAPYPGESEWVSWYNAYL